MGWNEGTNSLPWVPNVWSGVPSALKRANAKPYAPGLLSLPATTTLSPSAATAAAFTGPCTNGAVRATPVPLKSESAAPPMAKMLNNVRSSSASTGLGARRALETRAAELPMTDTGLSFRWPGAVRAGKVPVDSNGVETTTSRRVPHRAPPVAARAAPRRRQSFRRRDGARAD